MIVILRRAPARDFVSRGKGYVVIDNINRVSSNKGFTTVREPVVLYWFIAREGVSLREKVK